MAKTLEEIGQMVTALTLARIHEQGRAVDSYTKEELADLARDAAEDIQFALEITGQMPNPPET